MSTAYYVFDQGLDESVIVTDDDERYGPLSRGGDPVGPYNGLADAVLGTSKRGRAPFLDYFGQSLRLTVGMGSDGDALIMGQAAQGAAIELRSMTFEGPTGFRDWLRDGGLTQREQDDRDLRALAPGMDLQL